MSEPTFCDVIIMGGGIMGCSTAYHLLRRDPGLRVAVVERDPTYARASTTLSMANIREQFSLAQNVRISQYGLTVLQRFGGEMAVAGDAPAVNLRKEGNLFLVDAAGEAAAHENLARQQALGARVTWWDADTIHRHYPLYAPGDCVGGTFGASDGHFDAYALLMGYRRMIRHLGADLRHDEVTAVRIAKRRVAGVDLASGGRLSAPVTVNCCGAWCAPVAATAGVALPVQPVKRQVFVLDPAVAPPGPLPLTVLPSGLYFRSETGGTLLLGKSLPDDPPRIEFSWDDKRFLEHLWPELAAFVPAFDTLKLLRGWAGLYAVNTLDGNAIIGEWPELQGLFLANGFSGHGLQQGPAVGRYLAELILGEHPFMDLSCFGPQRILENRPLTETGLV